jgi:Na+/proline symporter
VAGFVCGLIGALVGLIPLLSWIAFPLGILGVVFGGIGWRRANREPERGGKGLAIAGLVLGILAVTLATIGIVIIDNAFD